MLTFKEIVNEALHKDVIETAKTPSQVFGYSRKSGTKIRSLNKTIKNLDSLNKEGSGAVPLEEGKHYPSGSSRVFIPHNDPEDITIEGRVPGGGKYTLNHKMYVGTKVAIDSPMNKFNTANYSLGQLQNQAERDDDKHRVLLKHNNIPNYYTDNSEYGIFPPIHDHDDDGHEHSTVGKCESLTQSSFRELTKNQDFPRGISHREFCDAVYRNERLRRGGWWNTSDPKEKEKEEKIDQHPDVVRFNQVHDETDAPIADYEQLKNLGAFHFPTKDKDGNIKTKKVLVALDHGFNNDVAKSYSLANANRVKANKKWW